MVRPLFWLALLCAGFQHLKLARVDANELESGTGCTPRRLQSRSDQLEENQYFTEYLIGNPPQRAQAIIDTASNLVWTQCADCSVCFRQDLPRYDPSRSRTARNVTCSDATCTAGLGSVTECSSDHTRTGCNVGSSHEFRAFETIGGELITDEFTFGPSSSEKKMSLAFECIGASTLSSGDVDGASGVVGLGRGPLSLVSQLGDGGDAMKFSYCLTPFFGNAINPSNLLVGAAAVLSGAAANAPVTTVPFVKNPKEYPFSTHHYLPLAGITVGKAKLAVPAAAFDLRKVTPGKWAGTMISSRDPFMSLVDVAFQALKVELKQQLGSSLVRPPKLHFSRDVELCVARADFDRLVPPMVLHFGSRDVVLPPENYWAPVGNQTACMVVFSSGRRMRTLERNETTVIGSFMQQNMQVLYDLGEGMLSFQPTDCTSFKPAPPGPAGPNRPGKRGSPSSSSSSLPVPLLLPVFSVVSLLMLNGAPWVRVVA